MSANLPAFVNTLAEVMARDRETPEVLDTADVYETLYAMRYDGPVVIHFNGGKPCALEVVRPVTWKLI